MAFPKSDPERFGKIAKDPFSWMSERGTMFSGTHDLSDGVNVSKPKSEVTLEEFMCFGAWHALHIWGDLDGFSSYACVKFNYPEPVSKHERFMMHEGSISSHCCFLASVLDTSKDDHMSIAVCECYSEVDASRITKLLNAEVRA